MISSVPERTDGPYERDQLTVAQLAGAARRRASQREPTLEEISVAVTELRAIAGPRRDLLAQVAGLLVGFYRGTAEEARASTAARYCRAAGADPGLIPRWVSEGERRASRARQHPYPGSLAS